jgi:FkbM family methyltransferase
MHSLRTLKQKLKRAYYALLGFRPDIDVPVETVNPGDQAWYHAANSLRRGDIVYSLGLATNIEFDLNLMAKYGAEVYGFDPTPESVDWIRQQNLPRSFHHHPVAVGGHDGEMIFELPQAGGQCARSVGPRSTPSGRTIAVPCRKVTSIAADLGHKRIALLKMDVEGSEYAILNDLLESDLQVHQILVEFHHRFRGLNLAMTKAAVRKLRSGGYKLIHLSPWCEEMTFIKE